MSTVLSGRVLTNANTAVVGATVNAYLTTDLVNAVDNTTTGADGTWSITGLDPGSYAVRVESNGKYHWYWPNSALLNRLTVGPEAVVATATGALEIATVATPAEGGDEDSPVLMIYGAYDSDPVPDDAAVTKTNYGMGLQSVVTNTAGTPSAVLRVVDNSKAATGIAFGEDGALTAGAITCESITVTGGGGATNALYNTHTPQNHTYATAQGYVTIFQQEVVIGAASIVHITSQLTWGPTSTAPIDVGVELFYTKDGGAEVQVGKAEVYNTQTSHLFNCAVTRYLSLDAGSYVFTVKSRVWSNGTARLTYASAWDSYLDIVVQPA